MKSIHDLESKLIFCFLNYGNRNFERIKLLKYKILHRVKSKYNFKRQKSEECFSRVMADEGKRRNEGRKIQNLTGKWATQQEKG